MLWSVKTMHINIFFTRKIFLLDCFFKYSEKCGVCLCPVSLWELELSLLQLNTCEEWSFAPILLQSSLRSNTNIPWYKHRGPGWFYLGHCRLEVLWSLSQDFFPSDLEFSAIHLPFNPDRLKPNKKTTPTARCFQHHVFTMEWSALGDVQCRDAFYTLDWSNVHLYKWKSEMNSNSFQFRKYYPFIHDERMKIKSWG